MRKLVELSTEDLTAIDMALEYAKTQIETSHIPVIGGIDAELEEYTEAEANSACRYLTEISTILNQVLKAGTGVIVVDQ